MMSDLFAINGGTEVETIGCCSINHKNRNGLSLGYLFEPDLLRVYATVNICSLVETDFFLISCSILV